jgi:DNA-binding transcriptional LysR family regulator
MPCSAATAASVAGSTSSSATTSATNRSNPAGVLVTSMRAYSSTAVGVGYAARAEREVSGPKLDLTAGEKERDPAFEDVEGLVGRVVDVQWRLVAAGLAISVLPALAPSPLQAGVAIRPLEGDRPARTLEIVEPAGRRMPAARAMAESIRAAAGKSVAATRS